MKLTAELRCTVHERSIFSRKNYFYPDLPKGYQLSQYDRPLATNGYLEIGSSQGSARKRVGIRRVHLEEDAGKSIHEMGDFTLIDFNRCGVPLIEIVTEPDLRSPQEAYEALARIRQVMLYLGVSDCNMEEGSLRCDANVSVRRKGDDRLGIKTEVKNMNSFRGVERALEFEIGRQIQRLEAGGPIVHETLLWDVVKFRTSALSLFSAISKDDLVRVLGSKKRLHTVTPLKAGTFFTSLSETSFMDSAVSRMRVISSAVNS